MEPDSQYKELQIAGFASKRRIKMEGLEDRETETETETETDRQRQTDRDRQTDRERDQPLWQHEAQPKTTNTI